MKGENEMVEKNKRKAEAREKRVQARFNTGTRTHKSKKDYKRKKKWVDTD